MGRLHETLLPESIALLVEFYGAGRYVRVPTNTANCDHFETIMGAEQTCRLVDEFGGGYIYLPGLPARNGQSRGPSLAEVKKRSVKESALAIAQSHNVSVRTIYNRRAQLARQTSEKHK